MFVVFENNGVLDERAIRTFGVSAKDNSNPIGYFGTGLKYAIAILLRHDCEIVILAGLNYYKFTTNKIEMRNKEFELIKMNESELPFTTELGKNWQLWQAFREIYCNCIDEKGSTFVSEQLPEPDPNKTYVIVNNSEFLQYYYDRNLIVMDESQMTPIHQGEVNIYAGSSPAIFYRSVRVMDLPGQSIFTYNIKESIELTEDRTVKYPSATTSRIAQEISRMKNKDIIRRILLASNRLFEGNLDYHSVSCWAEKISPEFMAVLEEEYRRNNDNLNASARHLFQTLAQKRGHKFYEKAELSSVEQMQFDRAVSICNRVWPEFSEYKIEIVKTLGQMTFGLADEKDQMIVISKRAFEMGTKFLTSTLIEEFMHLKTGYSDHSRELQTYLFDSLCTLVENHVINEPI